MKSFISQYAAHFENMIEYRVSLGYSGSTYKSRLLHLDRFIAKKHPDINDLSKSVIDEWLMLDPNETAASRKRRASIVRIFAAYLISVGEKAYVLPNGYIHGRRMFTPYILSDSELSELFYQIDRIDNSKKDCLKRCTAAVLFRLIYTCGLRPGEGLRLKKKDVNLETGEVFIEQGKHKKDRIVVMSDDMIRLMKEYSIHSAYAGRGEYEFFFSDSLGSPYTANWLSYILKTSFEKANPDIDPERLPRIRVYDLRHRFASATLCRWLDEGEHLFNMLPYLSRYMGHSDISHMAYYIHILPENILKSNGIDWQRLNDVIPEAEIWEE